MAPPEALQAPLDARRGHGWAMRHIVVVNRVVRRVVMSVVMHGWLLCLRIGGERT